MDCPAPKEQKISLFTSFSLAFSMSNLCEKNKSKCKKEGWTPLSELPFLLFEI